MHHAYNIMTKHSEGGGKQILQSAKNISFAAVCQSPFCHPCATASSLSDEGELVNGFTSPGKTSIESSQKWLGSLWIKGAVHQSYQWICFIVMLTSLLEYASIKHIPAPHTTYFTLWKHYDVISFSLSCMISVSFGKTNTHSPFPQSQITEDTKKTLLLLWN